MTALILALQVVLPLSLIGWLAFLPAGSLAGRGLQALGAAAFFFALARVAQWAVPVWWLPWVYGGLWLMVVLAWVLAGVARESRCFPTSRKDTQASPCR